MPAAWPPTSFISRRGEGAGPAFNPEANGSSPGGSTGHSADQALIRRGPARRPSRADKRGAWRRELLGEEEYAAPQPVPTVRGFLAARGRPINPAARS